MTHTLILGIGNSLLSDEGAGIHALDYLRARFPDPEGIEYLDGGTLSFTLAGVIQDTDQLIVLDAAQLNAAPGSVCCLVDAEMDRFMGNGRCSAHEVGLVDLMQIAHLTDSTPQRRALIGIQPQTLGWGQELSDCVANSMPEVARQVRQLVNIWNPQRKTAASCCSRWPHRKYGIVTSE